MKEKIKSIGRCTIIITNFKEIAKIVNEPRKFYVRRIGPEDSLLICKWEIDIRLGYMQIAIYRY